jgi:hypothetical protein
MYGVAGESCTIADTTKSGPTLGTGSNWKVACALENRSPVVEGPLPPFIMCSGEWEGARPRRKHLLLSSYTHSSLLCPHRELAPWIDV